MELVSAKQIQESTDNMNSKDVDIPFKDGLGFPEPEKDKMDLPNRLTSEDESELPEVVRPRKGTGWWSRSPP